MTTQANASERLFFAVPLSEPAHHFIEAACGPLLRGIAGKTTRLVPPVNRHFTLRFLGETAPSQRERLLEIAARAPLGDAFDLHFGGLGAFPSPRRARVLWLGVSDGAPKLRALAATMEAVAQQAGFAPEAKPFTPHLTLARFQNPRSLEAQIDVYRGEDMAMSVREFVLLRSELSPHGARYEVVQRFALTGAT